MLKEYKKTYQEAASIIPNWKSMTQIELADKYHEGGPLKDSYLAAEIVKFWNIIDRTLYKDKGLYDELEAYDWYISAILYALNNRPWDNPTSSIYKDPKAVEKILNMHIKCIRANWFQASNRYKRKINHAISSLESIQEDYYEGYQTKNEEFIGEPEVSPVDELVLEYFKKGQYVSAFIIDIIVNDLSLHSIDLKNDNSLIKNIKKCLQSIPDNYCEIFSEKYDVDLKEARNAISFIKSMGDSKLKISITLCIQKLRAMLEKEL